MLHDKLPTLCENPTAADKRMHYYRLVLWRRREMKRMEAWLLAADSHANAADSQANGGGVFDADKKPLCRFIYPPSPLSRACKMATDTLNILEAVRKDA
jgi:hypothetical protein